jgi:hypothetical protein
MKRYFSILLLLIISLPVTAEEGMWLPSIISQRIDHMRENGLKLTADDIYSVNQVSLKDGIVHFNGGCTGEIISSTGLLITNYHCGYGQIQAHSSIDHDYLKDGFWAMTIDKELPNKKLYVRFLVRMEDVTKNVLLGYKKNMSEIQRDSLIIANGKVIIDAAKNEGKGYGAKIEALYYGNQYFLFVYQTFTDVRLVGAPPTAIGKFGGDTDNWMWPRHTGDFSLFRIYADKDNNPAEYSADNVPYTPKKYFKISIKGLKEGDFTFVYGYPGKTQEYLYSEAVRYISDISNPNKIKLRTLRLNVQKEYMSCDQGIRIKYSSKNASVSNSWKKWQGEMKGIVKMNTYANKKNFEKKFDAWAADKSEYSGIIKKFAALYSEIENYAFASDYYSESIRANEIIRFAENLQNGIDKKENTDSIVNAFFKDYFIPIDKKCFGLLMHEYALNVPESLKPDFFKNKLKEFGSLESWVDYIFENSALTDSTKTRALISSGEFQKDPAVEFQYEFKNHYENNIKKEYNDINREITLLYRTYMRGQMEFCKDKTFYPDANSTLRITYGKIMGYSPSDGIYYSPVSTIEGIMQKDNPDIFDYNIPQKLRNIYTSKDYGKWGDNGTLPVCFIATNHTSGGNSGSPIIDENGNLIGINFDRVWEGTMSDIVFDPEICRNISLNMRFVLFTIDNIAGAKRLLDEIEVIE